MSDFILEPTDENLERLKRVRGETVYWHTEDFFLYDHNLLDELSVIFDAYMDEYDKTEEEDEETQLRKIGYVIGKRIVIAARRLGIPPQDFRDQFNNFATVVWIPICIWYRDESGNMRHSLMSNLPPTDNERSGPGRI